MAGALDPQATRDDRLARAAEVARRLDQGDEDARWTVSATEQGGYHFERLWRGVTDHHIVEASFIVSAEARKLHGLAAEQADSYIILPETNRWKSRDATRLGHLVGNYRALRSEEHTSELQSLMSISYAVFCLKKKKNT